MVNNRLFLITVDTEGDNQWDEHKFPTTENVKFIPRFQELCEKYHFIPTYLCNYEIATDEYFVNYMKNKSEQELCEIGMHLHAWYSPPEYLLNRINQSRDYLIEYPFEIMEAKIAFMTRLLTEKFGVSPVSHRSGRWALDQRYYDLLVKYGYEVDCSVTPLIDWSGSPGATGMPGTNYTAAKSEPFFISGGLLEVPVTIRKIHCFDYTRVSGIISFAQQLKRCIYGTNQWFRPDISLSIRGMQKLFTQVEPENDYLMFMIHSSELMPGGSPYFVTAQAIESLYRLLDELFGMVKSKGYRGIRLKDFKGKYFEGK